MCIRDRANPGAVVTCPVCGHRGGRVGGSSLRTQGYQVAQGAYTPERAGFRAPGSEEDAEPEEETSRSAVASLVLGLCFFVPPAGLFAIMFGVIALAQIKESKGREDQPDLKGRGLAIAGIVLGGVFQMAWFIAIIMALAGLGNLLEGAGL